MTGCVGRAGLTRLDAGLKGNVMVDHTAVPPELTGPTRHLLLSPHYDDIPLSVGATVRLLANHNLAPEVFVVFGSEPDRAQPLTDFARAMHEVWGLSAEEVIARRQAEERAAEGMLGAELHLLPFRDAIYRGAQYRSDDDLFGEPVAAEVMLPAELAAALPLPAEPEPRTRIYAPLGVGRHVDHQLVFRAGLDLQSRGWEVWLYEDIPYALKPEALERRIAEIGQQIPIETVASIPAEEGWEAKLDAILSYPSQLETVFRQYVGVGTSRDEIGAALAEYAGRGSDGHMKERFWQVVRSANPGGS